MKNTESLWQTALTHFHNGRLNQSRKVLGKLLKLNPKHGNAHLLSGIVAERKHDWVVAEKHLHEAVKLVPEKYETWFILGNTLRALGKAEEAIVAYRKAQKIQPAAAVFNNMGVAFEDMGHLVTALKHYQTALSIEPGFTPALYAVAPLLGRLRKADQARQAFECLMNKFPQDISVRLDFAEFLEQSNRIAESEQIRPDSKQFKDAPDYARSESLAAKLLIRNGQFEQAFQILAEAHDKTSQDFLLYRLGFLHDRSGNYSDALNAFKRANSARQSQWNFKRLADQPVFEYLDHKITTGFDLEVHETESPFNICFLVGLPRSGTTLLDRMLDAHPQIQVLEELEGLRTAESALANGATVQEAQTAYVNFIEEHVDLDRTSLIVDKHPFHAMHLDVIAKLFPAARVIFSVRHPFDAALSCFMQDFDPGPVTSKFLSLDTTAMLCRRYLTLLTLFETKFSSQVHRVYYEKLVSNPELEIKKVLEILQLDWHDDIEDYARKAAESNPIMTASYDQVIQPVYQKSINRWQNYADWLQPFYDQLAESAKQLGYSIDS